MAASSRCKSKKQVDENWNYCGVHLTIHNIIIPDERLYPTPAQLDNMDMETETDLRIVGCELIQDSGVLLRLPQVAMATAQVIYQRFFYSKSFVRHFYELVICYLQALDQESNHELVQTSWNYMNDSLRTDIFVRYLPEAIACGCIYLASCKLNIPLPRHPAWWEMFSVSEDSVREIALCLLRLYARPKLDVIKLEAELAQLRKSQIDAKERQHEQRKMGVTTPIHSDHSSEYILSPIIKKTDTCAKVNDLKKPSNVTVSNNSNGVSNPKLSDAPTTTLLASALANAKAMAASIAAAKSGLPNSYLDDERVTLISPDEMMEIDGLSDQNSEPTQSQRETTTVNNQYNQKSPGDVHKKPRKRTSDSQVRTSIRPAAYSNIPSRLDGKGNYPSKHKYSKKHRRRSLSASSTSASETENPNRPIGLVDTSANGRHYRQTGRSLSEHSSSGSESVDDNGSPVKHRDINNTQNRKHKKHRCRYISRSSSHGSQSSTSVSGDSRHNSLKRRNNTNNNRLRVSPPAPHRLPHKPYKSKHRTSKTQNNDSSCSVTGQSHYRSSSGRRNRRNRRQK